MRVDVSEIDSNVESTSRKVGEGGCYDIGGVKKIEQQESCRAKGEKERRIKGIKKGGEERESERMGKDFGKVKKKKKEKEKREKKG